MSSKLFLLLLLLMFVAYVCKGHSISEQHIQRNPALAEQIPEAERLVSCRRHQQPASTANARQIVESGRTLQRAAPLSHAQRIYCE